MSNRPNTNSSELWTRLKKEIGLFQKENGIDYLDYKKRAIYDFESERKNFEYEFFYFPCEETEANQNLEVFHEFYEIDVWGILGPVKHGDEQLELSLKQIARNVEIDRSKYIYDKLCEKYSYITEDIQRALIGTKKYFQFPKDHEESPLLVNLQNLYARILSSSESQLKIFEYINLNKTVSDIFTEILNAFIQDRIKVLSPRLKQYSKQVKSTLQVEATEMSKETPLIKLNYNPDQQIQIIQFLYNNLVPDFIEVSYQQFERHFFIKRSKLVRIIWKDKEVEIVHLFRSMKIKNIIIVEHQNKLIEHHFLNKKGEPFNNQQLSVSLTKTRIENHPEILHIIDNLEKLVLTFN